MFQMNGSNVSEGGNPAKGNEFLEKHFVEYATSSTDAASTSSHILLTQRSIACPRGSCAIRSGSARTRS